MSLERVLRDAVATLGTMGQDWCVVGGLAVAVRTPARITLDVDLAVAVDSDAEAEATVRAFLQRGWALTAAVEQEATGRLATARLQREAQPMLDLVFATCSIEPAIVADAIEIEILPGLHARTATIGHLVAMKLLSVQPARPRDQQDLVALLTIADELEMDRATRACAKIMANGAARGRDLEAMLEEWRATTGQVDPSGP